MDRQKTEPTKKNINYEKVELYKRLIKEGKYFVRSDDIAEKLSLQIIDDEKKRKATEFSL